MAGIITASMPVFVFEDETSGERAYVTINEGLGKTLRFGANGPDVIARLQWIRDCFAPLIAASDRNLRPHGHQAAGDARRCAAATNVTTATRRRPSGFFRAIAVPSGGDGAPHADIAEALRFIGGNDHFFLSLSIGHAKATTLAMEAVGGGSLVTTMAGNGREVGIRVSHAARGGSPRRREVADVRLFAGHDDCRSHADDGRSYVTEVIGLGAFALRPRRRLPNSSAAR